MKAVVVGAGIGGLAAARALRRAGVEAVVIERAHALDEKGAGIALAPNAVRVLEWLEVADEVRSHAVAGRRLVLRSWRGNPLFDLDYAAHGWEILGIHRADLQRILLASGG